MTKLTGNNQIEDVASGSDTRIRLDPEARIVIHGHPYVVVKLDETTNVLRRVDRFRVFASFTNAELQDLNARGLLIQDRGGLSLLERSLQYNPEITFWHLDGEIAELVEFRKHFCDAFIMLELNRRIDRSETTLAAVINHFYASWLDGVSKRKRFRDPYRSPPKDPTFPPPKPKTLRAWLRKYEAGDFKEMALCPLKHKSIIWSK